MGLEYVALPYLLFFLDLITSIGLLYPVCATTEGIVIGNVAERYQPLIGRPQHNLPFWLQQMEGFDPQAQIRCKGKVPGGIPLIDLIPPEMQLPPLDFNTPLIRRIYSNARELCAKPAYGGSLVAFNAGGYCAHQSSPQQYCSNVFLLADVKWEMVSREFFFSVSITVHAFMEISMS